MGFTNVFGGSTLQPSRVAYRAVALSANVSLSWPQVATDNNYVARIMEVAPSGAGLALTMPPANAVSPGEDVVWTNRGAQSYTVKDYAGSTILTVAAGEVKYLYLTDNSTTAGVWRSATLGVGTSSPDAASLQGLGLLAIGSTLNISSPVLATSMPTTITSNDRGASYVWQGGTNTMTLPAVSLVGSNFFFSVRNQGTGVLTLQPQASEFIDSAANLQLQPTESVIVHAGASPNWYTVGRGRNAQFNFTQLIKSVTGGTVTLSSTEAANVVQKYIGILASNCTVEFPNVVQVYYVSNATTGAFTLTFRAAGGGGTTVTLSQGQAAILFCDGTNVTNASTSVSGISSLTLNQGTAASPSIGYSGDTSTGIYSPATGAVGITAAGSEVGRFTSAGLQTAALVPTGATIPPNGIYLPSANTLGFASAGIARGTINSTGNWEILAPSSGNPLRVRWSADDGVIAGGVATNVSTRVALGFEGTGVFGLFYDRATGTGGLWRGTSAAGSRTDHVLISATGNVGFGVSPSVLVHAQRDSATFENLRIQNPNAAGAAYLQAIAASVEGGVYANAATAAVFVGAVSNHLTRFIVANVERGSISTGGNWTLLSPSSGATLTLAGSSAQFPTALTISDSTHATSRRAALDLGSRWLLLQDSNGNGVRNFALFDKVRSVTPIEISENGNISVGAPASGTAFTIAGGNIQVGAYANPRVILTNNSGTTSIITIGADSGNGFIGATTGLFYVVSEGATRLQFNTGGQGQFNAGLLVTGGRLQASDTLEVSGSTTLASAYGSAIALAASMAGSVHRLFIGDGSGWVFRFARRSGGVTTERLEIHDNAQLRAFSGASTDPSSVAFSATPTFDARNSNVFYFGTLTGNVTSMTISQPTDGQTIQIRFVQDGAGSKTVALPAGAVVSGSINPAANSVTWLVITWVNSVSRWEGTWTRIS